MKWPLHNDITPRLTGYVAGVGGMSKYRSPPERALTAADATSTSGSLRRPGRRVSAREPLLSETETRKSNTGEKDTIAAAAAAAAAADAARHPPLHA